MYQGCFYYTHIPMRRSTEERFWEKVKKTEGCWEWLSAKANGYGVFGCNGKSVYATRLIWFFTYGEWPKNYMCHTCDNPSCVNPKHLFDGTAKDNYDDAVKKNRISLGGRDPYSKIRERNRVMRLNYLAQLSL